MGDLSANFSKWEFTCKCGCDFCDIDQHLVEALQIIRDVVNRPVLILSGRRCQPHNLAVDGAPDSYHMRGKAADWTIFGLTTFDLFLLASMHTVSRLQGIGLYPSSNSIHTDVRLSPALWGFLEGYKVSFDTAIKYTRTIWQSQLDLCPQPGNET